MRKKFKYFMHVVDTNNQIDYGKLIYRQDLESKLVEMDWLSPNKSPDAVKNRVWTRRTPERSTHDLIELTKERYTLFVVLGLLNGDEIDKEELT